MCELEYFLTLSQLIILYMHWNVVTLLSELQFFLEQHRFELQRDGMGRAVGGGNGMGNTCKSMADSCQYIAKITTIL